MSGPRPLLPERIRQALLTVVPPLVIVFPIGLPIVVVRWAIRRGLAKEDGWFIVAIVAFVTVSVAHAQPSPDVVGITAAWVVVRGVRGFSSSLPVTPLKRAVLTGTALLIGLAVLEAVISGASRVAGPLWFHHPNVFGVALIAIGVGIAARFIDGWWLSLGFAVLIVAISTTGSRAALIGMVVTMILLNTLGAIRARHWFASVAAFAVTLTVAVLLSAPWATRLLGVVFTPPQRVSTNLLAATESLHDPSRWNVAGGVTVNPSTDTDPPRSFTIIRTQAVDWARPQQTVVLARNATYTLAADFNGDADAHPGFLLWGNQSGIVTDLRVMAAGSSEQSWEATGLLRDIVVRRGAMADGWDRVHVTFTTASDRSVELAVGVSPDLASALEPRAARVRALQLERGSIAGAYVVNEAPRVDGRGEALARRAYWDFALARIASYPPFGAGLGSFTADYREHGVEPDAARQPPGHAHNLFLHTLYENGVVGLVGVIALLGALLTAGDRWSCAVVVGAIIANLVDTTFMAAVVLLPLAAASGLAPKPASSGAEHERDTAARGTLRA